MGLRIFIAVVGAMACLHLNASRAAAYDLADYDWCFNNMPRLYDQKFEACVDATCTRISNKNVSQKRGCYRTCRGEAVEACLTQRAQGPAPKTVTRPAPSTPATVETTAQGIASSPAPNTAPESAAAEPAGEQGERDGFLSRLFGGFGGGPEQPAAPPQTVANPGEATVGEGRREGFFTRIANGLSEGITDGFDADYNWCRDHSGGAFQEQLQDCTRGCLAGPSSGANKRQGCIQSCKVTSVRVCIARRDGK